MKNRVYVLLNVKQGKSQEVAASLRTKDGVIMADTVDSPPDVIMVVEAEERTRLAELTVRALASVEIFTEELHLMPSKEIDEPCLSTVPCGFNKN